jgi:hypothetical protein
LKLSTCTHRVFGLGLAALLLSTLALPGWALIEPSDSQRETMVEMTIYAMKSRFCGYFQEHILIKVLSAKLPSQFCPI